MRTVEQSPVRGDRIAVARMVHVLGAMNYGGVESMALRLIRGLGAQDVDHAILYMGETSGAAEAAFKELPFEFVVCPYRPGHRMGFIRACTRALKRLRSDTVLAYNFGNHAMVSFAAWRAGVQTTYVRVASSPLRDRATRRKSMLLAHLARPFCRGEIAVSPSVGRELVKDLKLPPRRVHVIPNGCEVEEIHERAAVARRARLIGTTWRLLMVSRMDDAKDHPTLLRALGRLIQDGHSVELTFAGDGPLRLQHEAMCNRLGLSERVRFLGNSTDVPKLMGESDLLIHSSHTEGFGIVLIEAMAAGIPIVATDLLSCREILDSGRSGLLVDPRNPVSLAEGIVHVLGNPSAQHRLTSAAADRVRAYYDIKHTVQRYAQVLTKP